jgi:predicted outer membrane repeat protein
MVVDGITLTNGYVVPSYGGAVLIYRASPTFSNCRFVGNRASMEGGAVQIQESAPRFFDCHFADNEADEGGAVVSYLGSDPRFVGCIFSSNVAAGSGGAMKCENDGSVELTDCTFSGCSTDGAGGAISLWDGVEATISGCTLSGNSATGGAGIAESAHCSVENTIIAFSGAGGAIATDHAIVLSCCCLHGNAGGDWEGAIESQLGINGNSDEDPQFCSEQPGVDWDWTLEEDSPCAGANNPECGLIGAWDVGCGDTPTKITTWGEIKAGFRD